MLITIYQIDKKKEIDRILAKGYQPVNGMFFSAKDFVWGLGKIKINLKKSMVITIPDNHYDITWQELKEVINKYGLSVAKSIYDPYDCCFSHKYRLALIKMPSEAEIFKKCFLKNWEDFLDFKLLVFGLASFDIIQFDQFLHNEFGYTEEKHGSILDFLKKEFPNEFEDLEKCII